MVTAGVKLKDLLLGRKTHKSRQHIKNQRCYFTNKVPYSQSCGFPSHGEGNGNPLKYSCLENPIDRGAWWATVHEVAKHWTGLSS